MPNSGKSIALKPPECLVWTTMELSLFTVFMFLVVDLHRSSKILDAHPRHGRNSFHFHVIFENFGPNIRLVPPLELAASL